MQKTKVSQYIYIFFYFVFFIYWHPVNEYKQIAYFLHF